MIRNNLYYPKSTPLRRVIVDEATNEALARFPGVHINLELFTILCRFYAYA